MAASSSNMPLYAVAFMVFTMANVGLPGTSGFVGEFLTLLGTFAARQHLGRVLRDDRRHPVGGLCALALPPRDLRRARQSPKASLQDLSAREIAILAPLVVLVIFFGVYPARSSTPARPRSPNSSSTQSVAAAGVRSPLRRAH